MALPVTFSDAFLPNPPLPTYVGPFISPEGNVYTILRNSVDQIVALKATDPTSSFSIVDTQSGASWANSVSFAAFQSGNKIHCVLQHFDGSISYIRFDTSIDSFDVVDGGTTQFVIVSSSNASSDLLGAVTACDIAVLSNGTIRIVAQGPSFRSMGTNYSTIAHYESVNNGVNWSAGVSVSEATASDFLGPRITLPANNLDQCHIHHKIHNSFYRQKAISSTGTLRTERGSGVSITALYTPKGTAAVRAGTSIVRQPVKTGTFATVLAFNAFSDDSAPTISSQSIGSDGLASDDNTGVVCLASLNGKIHALYRHTNSTNLFYADDQGTDTWTVPVLEFTGTINHVSANVFVRDGNYKLAYVILDGTTVKYNEKDLGPWKAEAITFDGSNYLTRGGGLTGAVDGKKGTLSVWLRMANSGVHSYVIHSVSGTGATSRRFFMTRPSSNQLAVAIDNSSGIRILEGVTASNEFGIMSNWIHFLSSWDLEIGAFKIYINDVEAAFSGTPTITNETIGYTVTEVTIGGSSTGTSSRMVGDMSEFYLNIEEYMDLSVEANRRKFTDLDIGTGLLKPKYIGELGELPTGKSPIVYLSGVA